MLLVHDMAEADVGDQMISLNEPKRELKKQNDVLKKLFVKGTYPDIANLTHYYNVWTGYYNGMNVNAESQEILICYRRCTHFVNTIAVIRNILNLPMWKNG